MSHALVFDTLAYAKKLKAVGFTEDQAEVQAEELAKVIDENLATKHDLKVLEIALKRDLKELELHLTLKVGAMMSASIAIIVTLVKLL